MPGLRSLVARRRCSLPSAPVSQEPLLYTYPSVPGPISSRKGNSLDDTNQLENSLGNKNFDEENSKWDIKTLFELNDESLSNKSDHYASKEKVYPINGITLNGNDYSTSGKENNILANQCKNNLYDENSDIKSCQEIKEENFLCSSDIKKEFREDSKSENKISPERIVIKMKLLHGSSLSDVTNISSDKSDGCESNEKSEVLLDGVNTSWAKTQWTIDSIMNQPVDSPEKLSYNSLKNHMLEVKDIKIEKDEIENTNGNKLNDSYCVTEINSSENKIKILQDRDNSKIAIVKTCTEDIKPPLPILLNGNAVTDRRSSDRSDISEDSVCSDMSTASSTSLCSSASSVKSCSIVIKRLENSDSYSCFRSPKSKRKKCQEDLNKTMFCENKKASFPIMYTPKKSLNDFKTGVFPCSVKICDVFSNYPLRNEMCPRCLKLYNITNDVFINTIANTITFQCLTCKWLIIRSLKVREVDINCR